MLGRNVNLKDGGKNNGNLRGGKKIASFRTDDLDLVLRVTGDDEAAKLISTITLPQMVKVMKNLATKKQRSTPLLRSLAYNISGKDQVLNLKECADCLYSMASLNFPDPVLIAKLCADIQQGLKEPLEKSAVIGSILKSLSFLQYRDTTLLDSLIEWIAKNQDKCRTQDVITAFMTLATLNHVPVQQEEFLATKLSTALTQDDFKSGQEYLGYVWSLMVLNVAVQDQFDFVLQKKFIDQLIAESSDKELTTANKLKLLNINAGVKLLLPTYNGAMLMRENHQNILDVPLVHNKEKQEIVNGMVDAIKSLVPENCLKLHHDTNMGFVIGEYSCRMWFQGCSTLSIPRCYVLRRCLREASPE